MKIEIKKTAIYILTALLSIIIIIDAVYFSKAYKKSTSATFFNNSEKNEIAPNDNIKDDSLSGDEIKFGDEIKSGDLPAISGDTIEYSGEIVDDIPSDSKIETSQILKNTYQIENIENFNTILPLSFSAPNTYNNVKGITTFRGNNFRDSGFYGNVNVVEKKLTKSWTNTIGQTDNWTGIGWNGQPAIIEWDNEVKLHMNIYDKFKEKENFTEVIYGALDSTIHFYDLETGEETRPKLYVPSSIKGSVTIDPRGYPLLYVGQGINAVGGQAVKMGYHIFSLITGEELYFINGRDPFAYIGWGAFDGNPLINAESDTMLLPGENGLVYVVKLNTNYNKESGEISIAPTNTKYRFAVNGRANGMENSITAYKNKAYFINNHGMLHCLNLTTLTPEWSYAMGDDCDATLGLELENDKLMLYATSEVDRRKQSSPAHARKIDAETGNVIWEYECVCQYDSNVNGGSLSSPIVGKNEISNLVIFNFSKVNNLRDGKMVALDKLTGAVVWEKELTNYSWSSPVAVYSDDGKAYIVFGDSIGRILLIEATTGKTLYTLNTGGGNIEGSPAIFNNKIIIGTRGKKIYCIEIS